jgi:hypothetical protein
VSHGALGRRETTTKETTMKKIQATSIALLLGAVTVGCNGASRETELVESSKARLVMAVHDHDEATLHVTAKDDETQEVVLDRVVDLKAGGASVLDVDLEPTMYTFHVDVMDGSLVLGAATGQVDLDPGVVTEVQMTAAVDAKGSTTVEIGVDDAPQINKVTVEIGEGAGGTAKIHVDATDPDGDALAYYWTGAGIDGAVKGSATMTIPAAQIAGEGVVHVVVQDAKGATTSADVEVTISGDAQSTLATYGAPSAACLEAQASCNAKCEASFGLVDVLAKTACFTDCTLALTSCKAP